MHREVELPDPIELWIADLAADERAVRRCIAGRHYMRRDADGKRCWECTHCGERRPFNVDGED